MNFIDKDAVVATIKKHVQEERHSYFCKCLLSEIDALEVKEQPSLPDNLDEAAWQYAEQEVKTWGSTEPDDKKEVHDDFIAGAEWDREQMMKASRNVYESWMGGTMDDVRRDMVELGKVLNARKEEKKCMI